MNTQAITYDPAGNITALTETGTGTSGSKTAYYDSFDRLTSFFNATNTTSYSYDADSNRTSSTVLSTTTTYTYPGTSNRLTSLGGTTTYSYDSSGNTTGDGTNTWTYDSRGRMASLIAGTTTATYSINGFGQRITKSGSLVPSGGTNEFVYDEQGHLIGEYGSAGASIEETVYLPDTPVSVLSKGPGLAGFGANAPPIAVLNGSGTVSSVTPDWLGVAHIITNASKVYQWIWDHYAFWDNAPNQNPSGLGGYNYSLRGPQYKDIETNTNQSYFRDCYNPLTGRFCESDPIGLGGGINTYAYVLNNPLSFTDPHGTSISWDNACFQTCLVKEAREITPPGLSISAFLTMLEYVSKYGKFPPWVKGSGECLPGVDIALWAKDVTEALGKCSTEALNYCIPFEQIPQVSTGPRVNEPQNEPQPVPPSGPVQGPPNPVFDQPGYPDIPVVGISISRQ